MQVERLDCLLRCVGKSDEVSHSPQQHFRVIFTRCMLERMWDFVQLSKTDRRRRRRRRWTSLCCIESFTKKQGIKTLNNTTVCRDCTSTETRTALEHWRIWRYKRTGQLTLDVLTGRSRVIVNIASFAKADTPMVFLTSVRQYGWRTHPFVKGLIL